MAAVRTLLLSLLIAVLGATWGTDALAHPGHGAPPTVAASDVAPRTEHAVASAAGQSLATAGVDCDGPSGTHGGMSHSSGCCASSGACCAVLAFAVPVGPARFAASVVLPMPGDPRHGTSPGIDIRPPISRLR